MFTRKVLVRDSRKCLSGHGNDRLRCREYTPEREESGDSEPRGRCGEGRRTLQVKGRSRNRVKTITGTTEEPNFGTVRAMEIFLG